jgi:hypothetical protein
LVFSSDLLLNAITEGFYCIKIEGVLGQSLK